MIQTRRAHTEFTFILLASVSHDMVLALRRLPFRLRGGVTYVVACQLLFLYNKSAHECVMVNGFVQSCSANLIHVPSVS